MMTRQEVSKLVQAAMVQHGVTFAELAEELGRPPVWVAADDKPRLDVRGHEEPTQTCVARRRRCGQYSQRHQRDDNDSP